MHRLQPTRCALLALAATAAMVAAAHAQVMVYPARGQTQAQQQRDTGECTGWAQQQSGFNPTAPVNMAPPPPSYDQNDRPVLRGAARGAVIGTVGGAIGGDAGKGAAIGAASGALIGGMRRRDQERQYAYQSQQYQQQQQAAYSQQQSNFNRAYAACLEGRGYTVR
ncbi:MAG TPA: glycine zipper family protein [Alphaproteobacteria bacterium]|nr:glycine zipper family protein [Alphaproteobacteria bacterium]